MELRRAIDPDGYRIVYIIMSNSMTEATPEDIDCFNKYGYVVVKNLTMAHLDPGSQSIPFCTATMVAISQLYQNYCKVIMYIEELCI